jgi:hypothetical protein
MRLTNSDTAGMSTTYTEQGLNLATSATVSSTDPLGDPQSIQDNNDRTSTVSTDNPTFPQYITYSWPTGQSVNQIAFSTNYGQGQGITNVNIQVTTDGTTWTQVDSSGTMTYATNNSTIETKTLNFAPQTGVKGLRIQINAANLTWKHYALTEFKVFNATSTNLATSATVNAPGLVGNATVIQDNNFTTNTVSTDNPTFPQNITYTWSSSQSVNQVVLETNYGQGQGITNATILVTTDGTTWTQVATTGTMTYATNSSTIEAQIITFSTQSNVVGVRIQINAANLTWKHYALTELQVYYT